MIRVKQFIAFTALAAVGIGSAYAQSTPSTKTFNVKLKIEESCAFSSAAPTDVDFGTVARSVDPADTNGVLSVDCTVGTSYKVSLNEGANSTATTATDSNRRMKSTIGGADYYVAYGLYQDSTYADLWGSEADSLHLSKTAGAISENINVYGRVPAGQTDKPAGDYIDTVTATLTF